MKGKCCKKKKCGKGKKTHKMPDGSTMKGAKHSPKKKQLVNQFKMRRASMY